MILFVSQLPPVVENDIVRGIDGVTLRVYIQMFNG